MDVPRRLWATSHRLETVTLTLHLPSESPRREPSLDVAGQSDTKRSLLWSHHEELDGCDVRMMLDIADHFLSAAWIHAPNTSERLEFVMNGGLMEEVPLF